MASIFTKIIEGEIPSYKIAENDHCFAFLDIRPIQIGHSLVIPKKEVDYIFDVEDALLSEMMRFAKKVAKAIESTIECKRISVGVFGLEVPHAHIHLIPMNKMSDVSFTNVPKELTKEQFIALADQIAKAYENPSAGSV